RDAAAAGGRPAHGAGSDRRFDGGPENGPSGNEPRSAGYRRAAGPASAGAVRSERVRNRATARQPSIPTAVTTAVTITKETSVPAENRVRSAIAVASVIAHTNTPCGHT